MDGSRQGGGQFVPSRIENHVDSFENYLKFFGVWAIILLESLQTNFNMKNIRQKEYEIITVRL
jgi:hypothetical protein